MLIGFREKGREGAREGEKQPAPNLQTFSLLDDGPTTWATLAGADRNLFIWWNRLVKQFSRKTLLHIVYLQFLLSRSIQIVWISENFEELECL